MDTEEQLISRAQQALSQCNWTIGECATTWTQRYAKGRTDGDFGQLIGLSADQVYQRRRVWETFADVYQEYAVLKWSHFYVALNWDDASECLQWANEMESTVAEMKAWRRAQRGEDLTTPPADEPPFDLPSEFLTATTGVVRDAYGEGGARTGSGGVALLDVEANPSVQAAARQSSGEEYAPFNAKARGSAPVDGDREQAEVTTEQLVKRMCAALERCAASITPAVIEEFGDLPFSLQQRFRNALTQLQDRVASWE